MAETKIADIIEPEVFLNYVTERTAETAAFWQSGIVQDVGELGVTAEEGGSIIQMPFFQDLSGAEEVLSDTSPLGVDKITTAKDVAVLHVRGKAWGSNDLAKLLAGADPMMAIGNLVAGYWARRMQVLLIQTLEGVFAAASMSGNLHDISGASGALANINGSTFIDATYKLGDAADMVQAVAMHSATVAQLAKNDLGVEDVRDSEGNLLFRTWMGKRIIVSDSLPVDTGNYTSYLFASGAIGFGEGRHPMPVETDRDSLQGSDILINRRAFVLHPRGVSWTGTPAGVGPTNVEVAVGTNWARVWEAKNVKIVKFKHKLNAS